MPPSPPPAGPTPAPVPLLRLGIFGGWLLFTLMVVAITWGGNVVRGRPLDVGAVLLWNLGWLLWAGATFAVAWLARRFPLERGRLAPGLAMHAALGLATGVALLGLEFLIAHALGAVWPGAPRPNAFLGFIVYKFHVYFLIYWMILGATRAYDYHAQFRASTLRASQLEAQLAHARLHALQAQLQPHFLFNTHHAIVSLMLKADNAAAIRMLTRLSDLLRVTLHRADQPFCSLREELEALELYLGIQRERYGGRLDVQLDVAPDTLTAAVPWLLLQPLVENALKHGIDARPAGGVLHLAARTQDGRLHLVVRDNGPGFPADFAPERAGGIGLRNTRARLAQHYGAASTLELAAAPGGGAEVRLSLPCRAHAPAHE